MIEHWYKHQSYKTTLTGTVHGLFFLFLSAKGWPTALVFRYPWLGPHARTTQCWPYLLRAESTHLIARVTVVTPREVMLIERAPRKTTSSLTTEMSLNTSFSFPNPLSFKEIMIFYIIGFMSSCKLYRVLNHLCIFGYCRLETP